MSEDIKKWFRLFDQLPLPFFQGAFEPESLINSVMISLEHGITTNNTDLFAGSVCSLYQIQPITSFLIPSLKFAIETVIQMYGEHSIALPNASGEFLQCKVKEILETLLELIEERTRG